MVYSRGPSRLCFQQSGHKPGIGGFNILWNMKHLFWPWLCSIWENFRCLQISYSHDQLSHIDEGFLAVERSRIFWTRNAKHANSWVYNWRVRKEKPLGAMTQVTVSYLIVQSNAMHMLVSILVSLCTMEVQSIIAGTRLVKITCWLMVEAGRVGQHRRLVWWLFQWPTS
jgi:hypothetical protein